MTPINALPSVLHMLARACEANPGGEALVCGAARLTYADLSASVVGLASDLATKGVAGDRVAIVLPNSVDLVVALLAVMASGAQAALLNPAYTARELSPILTDADPLLVICDSERLDRIRTALGNRSRAGIMMAGSAGDAFVARATLAVSVPLPSPHGLALLQYTGGTTGQSKGVSLLHRMIATNVAQREAYLPTRPRVERFLAMTPLFHAYALAMALFPALYSMGTVIVLPRFRTEVALATIQAEGVTLFAGMPTIYNGLIAHESFARADYRTLVGAYSGAAPLSTEVLSTWEQVTKVPIAEGYGLTEATAILCFNPLNAPRKPGSVGLPVPGTDIDIVDIESGLRSLPVGTLGEVRARGPQLMTGYRNRPDETREAIRDGWLYTGDIGERDSEGYLYIRDRKKDMILVSGYNVYPREIDEVLYSHPAVLEAVAAGVDDPHRGEAVQALVSLRPGAQGNEEMLLAHCASNLASYKRPSRIFIVDDIPKTAAGKADRKRARALLQASGA